MKRKVLSQSKIFTGILPQKGLNFDTQTVTYEVMKQHLDGNFVNANYTKLPLTKYCEYLMYYLSTEWFVQKHKEKPYVGNAYGGSIRLQNQYGYVQLPTYSSKSRNHVDVDLTKTPDQVMILALNVKDASANIVFEYDDHKRKNRSISHQITCDSFYFFPSDIKYYITRNNSDYINHYVIQTYDESYD